MAGGLIFGQEREPESPPPARQNEILRDYFREQYQHVTVERMFLSDRFKEMYVDRQIDHLLEQVSRLLQEVSSCWEESQSLRRELAAGGFSSPENLTDRRRLMTSLKQVEDAARDLRGMLNLIFKGLRGKEDFKPDFDGDERQHGFEKEFCFLEEQIGRAHQQIRSYLFESDNTVRLDELQGENMLIHLYRVERMAKAIREKL